MSTPVANRQAKAAAGKAIAEMRESLQLAQENEVETTYARIKAKHQEEKANLVESCKNATGHNWENVSGSTDRYIGIPRIRCKYCHAIK